MATERLSADDFTIVDLWGDAAIVDCPTCSRSLYFACEYQPAEYDVGIDADYVCTAHARYPHDCTCGHDRSVIDALIERIEREMSESAHDHGW
jgi:hypothetical protein